MFDELTFTGRELLLAVVLATVVYLIEIIVFSRRRSPDRDHALAKRLADMEAELTAINARLETLEFHPPVDSALDTQSTTYAEAVRMALEGYPSQEMMERLGISRSEAELISALHKTGS